MKQVERILHLIALQGITPKELTVNAKLPMSAVSEWKKGKAKPSADAIVRISQYFDVPIEYILGVGVFSNWEELRNDEAREAITSAVGNDFPTACIANGTPVRVMFDRAVRGLEMDMIKLFSWAVKSVELEESDEYDYYYGHNIIEASIEYSEVLSMMSYEPDNIGKSYTAKELMDAAMKRVTGGKYENLYDDEKRLLDAYRCLSEEQQVEVFRAIYEMDPLFAPRHSIAEISDISHPMDRPLAAEHREDGDKK